MGRHELAPPPLDGLRGVAALKIRLLKGHKFLEQSLVVALADALYSGLVRLRAVSFSRTRMKA